MPKAAASSSPPGFIAPMLATPARELPPDVKSWTAEAKWDGQRACVLAGGGRFRVWSRNGADITGRYPEIAVLAGQAGRRTLILDGEIVAVASGRPDFSLLQHRMHITRPSAQLLAAVPVTFVVFDLLWMGKSLLGNPHAHRRILLDNLGLGVSGAVQVPAAFPGEGQAVLDAAAGQGWEGVMLKRPASRYVPGSRSRDWIKVKVTRTADILIGGWLPGSGNRADRAGSVLAARPGPTGLEFLGQVGTAMPEAAVRELTAALHAIEQAASPFAAPLPAAVERRARWVRPVLAAEVAYTEITPSGRLRHPVWRGLRP
jgi:bifunctional non-homologous end joining protein LigD